MTLDNSIAIIPLQEYEQMRKELENKRKDDNEYIKKIGLDLLYFVTSERLWDTLLKEVPGMHDVFNADSAEWIWKKFTKGSH